MIKNKNPDIKAVIFDIGGVLLFGDEEVKYGHQNINVHRELSKKVGINLKRWFDLLGEHYSKAIKGELNKEQLFKELGKRLDLDPKKLEKMFIRAHRKYFKKNKKLLKFSKKLRKDYYVGILSDQAPVSKKVFLEKINMEKFNPVVISCDIGMRKPEKKIYKYLKKELDNLAEKNSDKIKYSEIVFIDNRDWNLKPARELGMQTVLFKNNKQTIQELKELLKDDKK